MTAFPCTRCGKCCVSLGRHIEVVRCTSPRSCVARVKVTGEILHVQVVPSLVPLFSRREPPSWEEGWCPFLRREDDRFTCTIYPFRPRICREFKCVTMRILGPAGREAGRVKGKASLVSDDPVLRSLWSVEIAPLSNLPEREFAARCRGILEPRGYTLELFEG
ncbi:MAG: YkgJ family cysteine cluster protein [Methanolinea sp.]